MPGQPFQLPGGPGALPGQVGGIEGRINRPSREELLALRAMLMQQTPTQPPPQTGFPVALRSPTDYREAQAMELLRRLVPAPDAKPKTARGA